jgi:hypothetical protein
LLVHFLIALVPGTAGSKTIQRWLSIAYVVEIFLLALSILMVRAGIGLTEFGIFLFSLSVIFLMLTGLFHIAIHLIGERIRNLLQSLLSAEEV